MSSTAKNSLSSFNNPPQGKRPSSSMFSSISLNSLISAVNDRIPNYLLIPNQFQLTIKIRQKNKNQSYSDVEKKKKTTTKKKKLESADLLILHRLAAPVAALPHQLAVHLQR